MKTIKAKGARPMSPQEFQEAKLISLLSIVAILHKDALSLRPAVYGESEEEAEVASKKLTDMFFGLLQACHRFFPSPGELEKAVEQFALSIGIVIEVEALAPSSKVPQ